MVSNGNSANLALNKIREYLNSGEPSCSEGEKNLRDAFFFEMLYFNLWEENNPDKKLSHYLYFPDFYSAKTTMETVVKKAKKPKHQWFIPGGCLNYVLKHQNYNHLCELTYASFRKLQNLKKVKSNVKNRETEVNGWLAKKKDTASDPLITWWKRTHASVSKNSSEDSSSSSSIYRSETLSFTESSSSSVRKYSSISLSDDDDSQPSFKKQCVQGEHNLEITQIKGAHEQEKRDLEQKFEQKYRDLEQKFEQKNRDHEQEIKRLKEELQKKQQNENFTSIQAQVNFWSNLKNVLK